MSSSPARERWSRLVRELEASGLPVREFARTRSVHPSTLSWWRSRLRSEHRRAPAAPAFAELVVVDTVAEDRGDHLVLDLPRLAARVRVDAATDLRLLRAVLDALC